MSRNYGLGSRDMKSAGRIALDKAADKKEMSFSTADTVADRWSQFVVYAKENGVGRMERITPELVTEYGKLLAGKVTNREQNIKEREQLAASTAQNLLSAVNTVMHLVRGSWASVSPTKTCQISERTMIRTTVPAGLDRSVSAIAINALKEAGLPRAAIVAELARELGLRSKEASLLDANKALREAGKNGSIRVSDGTKGGRVRELTLTQQQISVLEKAAAIQGANRSIMPANIDWNKFRSTELKLGRQVLQSSGIRGYHDQRAAYACDRYQVITGQPAPVCGGGIPDREADMAARYQISEELGHGRADVASSYIGGRG